jgi:hypothetical protein
MVCDEFTSKEVRRRISEAKTVRLYSDANRETAQRQCFNVEPREFNFQPGWTFKKPKESRK